MQFLNQVRRSLGKILCPYRRVWSDSRWDSRLDPRSDPYYPRQKSCQIPNLEFLFEKFFGQRETGTFVEIGAHDGVLVSNTWGLAARGWQGWMVEPVPNLAARCRLNHEFHKDVKVFDQAIGSAETNEVTLFVADALTTANPELFEEYSTLPWATSSLSQEKITVPSTTLDDFLARCEVPVGFDVLVVDVEGFEAAVFSGFQVNLWQPKMMIVELADTHPDLTVTAKSDYELSSKLQSEGYTIVYKDSINTVFVRQGICDLACG